MKNQFITCKCVVAGIGMTWSEAGGSGEEAVGRRIEVFVEKGIFPGGPPLLPTLFAKTRVIPKKENPNLRGFDD